MSIMNRLYDHLVSEGVPFRNIVSALTDPVEVSDLVVMDDNRLDITDTAPVQAAIATFDPVDYAALYAAEAQTKFAAVPGWYGWSPEEMEQYIVDNVNDLASAKLALRKMAFAIGVLADKVFPGRR